MAPRSEGCSLCSPPPTLGASGRGRGGKGLRWKSFAGGRSQRRMFAMLGVSDGQHRVPDHLSQMPWQVSLQCRGMSPALLVQPLPARVPSRSVGFRPDRGITHWFSVDFPSSTTWPGKAKTYRRKSRTRNKKNHNGFLASLRPRNRLFIADACWQKDNPIRQGTFWCQETSSVSQVLRNSCCFSLWYLVSYQGFVSNPWAVRQPRWSKSREGTLSDEFRTWRSQAHVQSCLQEQDLFVRQS